MLTPAEEKELKLSLKRDRRLRRKLEAGMLSKREELAARNMAALLSNPNVMGRDYWESLGTDPHDGQHLAKVALMHADATLKSLEQPCKDT